MIGTLGTGNCRGYVTFSQPAHSPIPLPPSDSVVNETPWWEYATIAAESLAAVRIFGFAYCEYHNEIFNYRKSQNL